MRGRWWTPRRDAGVVHAVTFNYRGNPLVQQAREMIAAGEIGEPHFVHGAYLQDWLLQQTDFSWRLEPEKGGRSSAIGDIGSHWCDLVQHVVGERIESVLADFTTVVPTRFKPANDRRRSPTPPRLRRRPADERASRSRSTAKIWRPCSCASSTARRGAMSVGQVCAGHKNDLWFEVNGARLVALAAGTAERALDRPSRRSRTPCS